MADSAAPAAFLRQQSVFAVRVRGVLSLLYRPANARRARFVDGGGNFFGEFRERSAQDRLRRVVFGKNENSQKGVSPFR